jgi:hypothetical protein
MMIRTVKKMNGITYRVGLQPGLGRNEKDDRSLFGWFSLWSRHAVHRVDPRLWDRNRGWQHHTPMLLFQATTTCVINHVRAVLDTLFKAINTNTVCRLLYCIGPFYCNPIMDCWCYCMYWPLRGLTQPPYWYSWEGAVLQCFKDKITCISIFFLVGTVTLVLSKKLLDLYV